MANIYVRSTDGSDADNGSTWALAKATLTGAAAIDAAGDTIFVSDNHSESTASSVTLSLAGTLASPTRIICGDDAAEPPTNVSTSGVVAVTGTSNFSISGEAAYINGLTFNIGSTATTAHWQYASNGKVVLENCNVNLSGSGSNSRVIVGNGSATRSDLVLKNVNMTFGSTSQSLTVSGGSLVWEGGGITSGSAITNLFKATASNARGGDILLSGVDFSGCAAGLVIFSTSSTTPWGGVIRDCKLPASWSGSLATGTFTTGERFELYNCDSGDTNYRLWVQDYAGSTRDETTVVRSGGASDGETGLSWKMATTANSSYPMVAHSSPEIVQWNATTGSSVTATIEIVHDSQGSGSGSKFQDDEVWLEVMYLGTSGYPLGTWITDCKAAVLAAAANQADSSETWTTTGLTSPVKQKLSVTFTPQEKGFIHARVVLAKASKTCYVCPKLTVA